MKQEEFLKGVGNWDNYKPLLWLALENTAGSILELGCGDGSTKLLQKYSNVTGRELRSYDYNKEWADKFGATHITDWSKFDFSKKISVVLVDESPGEQRKNSILALKGNAEIIIIHDSEPKGWNASDYRVRPTFKNFKYGVDIMPNEKGEAWATALSDDINLHEWIGEELGGYKISKLSQLV